MKYRYIINKIHLVKRFDINNNSRSLIKQINNKSLDTKKKAKTDNLCFSAKKIILKVEKRRLDEYDFSSEGKVNFFYNFRKFLL